MVRKNHVVVAMLCESKAHADASRGCHQDVRKAVELSLHIKDGIYQLSCFSKTIVMSIAPPSIYRLTWNQDLE